ncbi:3-oxoacyl-ACP synthase III family protein [Parachryseolinea silvisoli]|uniref:3-oxoacyl-ACP synthase III family protein n=1 Tax=Parachryseolinea silvisoli TaxID=2873601 RepID=UPI002265F431|nr:ketoacyl-ACP synthase III [Parachryseolinea silvisoli]MCD9015172.1 ketoacyl-ACP synthase III [Parachryseolinea silvisoli]
MTSIIIGTGSYIPDIQIQNSDFLNAVFFESNGTRVGKRNETIVEKFSEITGINARRYAREDQLASDLAYLSAQQAIETASIDKETLDYIIVAHNFGDVASKSNRVTMVPSLGSKVKALLGIQNPDCIAYDLPFGCPGWIEGFIQANYFIKSGDARRCLVIGTETLSRVVDQHDRDSMIFSDGAGAIILEVSQDDFRGVLSHKTQTYAVEHANLLSMGPSNNLEYEIRSDLFLKMNGRRVYEFALSYVPLLIKTALDKAGLHLKDINKILIHQANEKMDIAITERLFKLYDLSSIPEGVVPMTIDFLGNSSVATVPTLLDLILKGKLQNHRITDGDRVVFASVGAGMNINALVYQF